MYCRKCGQENDAGAIYCKSCGSKLIPDTGKPEEVKAAGTRIKSRHRKTGIIVIGAAVCICACAGGVYLHHKNVEKKYNSYIQQAQVCAETMEYSKEEESLKEALKLEPKRVQAYMMLGEMYQKQMHYDKALEIMKQGNAYAKDSAMQDKIEEIIKIQQEFIELDEEWETIPDDFELEPYQNFDNMLFSPSIINGAQDKFTKQRSVSVISAWEERGKGSYTYKYKTPPGITALDKRIIKSRSGELIGNQLHLDSGEGSLSWFMELENMTGINYTYSMGVSSMNAKRGCNYLVKNNTGLFLLEFTMEYTGNEDGIEKLDEGTSIVQQIVIRDLYGHRDINLQYDYSLRTEAYCYTYNQERIQAESKTVQTDPFHSYSVSYEGEFKFSTREDALAYLRSELEKVELEEILGSSEMPGILDNADVLYGWDNTVSKPGELKTEDITSTVTFMR